MAYVVGIVLSLSVAVFARRVGFDLRPGVLSDGADRDCVVLRVVCCDATALLSSCSA